MSAEKLEAPLHVSPRRLCHGNIFVSDVRASLAFYNKICGFEVVLEQPQIRAGFVSNGNTHHDVGMIQVTKEAVLGEDGHRILAPGQGARPGLNHLGWEMESEFELTKAYERAQAAGWKAHRTVRHRSSHSVYFFDPDGNIHEFYADVSKDWRDLYDSETSVSGEWKPGKNEPSTDARYHAQPDIRIVKDAPIHPVRITHAVLKARNFDRMCAFFRNGAGLLEKWRDDERGFAAYTAPACSYSAAIFLVRQESNDPHDRGLIRFAFELPSVTEVSAAIQRLVTAGVPVDRIIKEAHKESFLIKDPDGMVLEFYATTPAQKELGIKGAMTAESHYGF